MIHGLYAITPDLSDTASLLEKTGQVLANGTGILQYRNKLADALLAKEQALALRRITREHGITLIINDDLDLALAVGADGVHLGGDDGDLLAARNRMPEGMLLGASCYNDLTCARAAAAAGADYVAFGAIFPSGTKPLARRASLDLIKQARAELAVPIVAIGGITLHNAAEVIAAGADSIAVIAALFDAPDIGKAARQFSDLFHVKQPDPALGASS